MEVKMDGFTLASILYDQFNSSSDTEGFLLGETLNICSEVIDDYSSDVKEHKDIYVVKNVVSCWGLGSWYNNTCDLDNGKINNILGDQKEQVIGWFRTRKHTSQMVSFKERTLHTHLQEIFIQPHPPSNLYLISPPSQQSNPIPQTSQKSFQHPSKLPFLFLLLTTNNPNSNPLNSYNFHCSSMDASGQFRALEMKVDNLTITSPLEYRRGGGDCVTRNKQVQALLSNSDDFFRDRSDVNKMIKISSGLVSQISIIVLALLESESELEVEVRELFELRKQVESKKEEKQELAASQKQETTKQQQATTKQQQPTTKQQQPTTKQQKASTSFQQVKSITPTPKTTISKTILTAPNTNSKTSEQKEPGKLTDQTQIQPPASSHTKTYQLMTFEDDKEDVSSNTKEENYGLETNASK